MNVDTIRTRPASEPESEPDLEPESKSASESESADSGTRRVVDVSDLRADRIEAFADGGAVHLERRGGKTYLVAEG